MEKIDPSKLPEHIAVIMDGNGRWAKKRAMNRIKGHEEGTESVRVIVRTSRNIGIKWLTLYAFSEENWKRPNHEVNALMGILKRFLKSELAEMLDNGIRFQTIGNTDRLPEDVRKLLKETIDKTSENNKMVLSLALSYGSRQEILGAVRKIGEDIESGKLHARDISEETFKNGLYTSDIPDPELLIRTSGEYRVSNFLLWQIAYTEIYITPTLWPDFREEEFLHAIEDFQERERRFGAVGK
jgi:undecaprenyl diphosphate synthase